MSDTSVRFDAVLCDLDGVIRHWDSGMEKLDRAYGLAEGTLAGFAFAPDRLRPAITGRVSDSEWRAQVAADLADTCGSTDRANELVAEFSALRGRVDEDVLSLIFSVRQKTPVVLVTNQTTSLESDLPAIGLADAFDAVVNSARVGFAKPDERIFRFAAQRAGTTLDRCLFVDDEKQNVDAASALGMTAIHYTGIDTLRAAIG